MTAPGILRRSPDGDYVVEATHPVKYGVTVTDGVLQQTLPFPEPGSDRDPLGRVPGGSMRRLVVADREVARLYGDPIQEFLTRHGIEFRLVAIPGGESSKRWKTVRRLCREFDSFGINRRGEPIIVFGGGVVLDVVGLAASIYRRGIPRLIFPTTLVGQIDAGLGVKTGVDFGPFKNRLGTYAPAQWATIDRRFLATLDARRLSDGLAEILKVGIAVDASLFEVLRADGRKVLHESFQGRTDSGDRAAREILDSSIRGMLGELAPNLREDEMARSVYLGHTWSPAVEMEALCRSQRWWLPWRRRPSLLHGEAVALDMMLSAGIALDRGHIDKAEYELIAETTDSLGLPLWDSLLANSRLLARGLRDTTRHRGGRQLAPLPQGGKVAFASDITASEVARAARRQHSLGGRAIG
ncbi:2-epi-5-epi-valiolone synthase [Streptomyces cupreus]|nr:2-epi-5-epi-valiolone synthase [Streptomyces cupreus]